ncbi:GerAB/ArcD/ProY family transporter [Lutispora saccharofermentans]|uniref:Spore germination protein n=1 Tax=Lutispora saccharofermentans TaxID=3024236 RepID=A0ABT1NGY1_9FIRM|nr:GerAB/ArcD/ProY family transporter [Lutispora saccharofermentans]MCQ1530489.1 spore germination protein [Lutispora saccharofermentans]
MLYRAGKILAKFIYLLYFFIFLTSTSVYLRDFSELFYLSILPSVPLQVFALFIMALVVYLSYMKIPILGRISEAAFIIIYFFVFIVILISINKLDYKNLLPVFNGGLKPIIYGTIAHAPVYEDLIIWLFLIPNLQNKADIKKWLPLSALASGVITLAVSTTVIGFFGAPLTSKLDFPFYYYFRSLEIGNNISGIDILFIPIWYFVSFIKIGVYFFALLNIVKRLFGLSSCNDYIIPISLIIISLAMIMFRGHDDLVEFISIKVSAEIAPIYGLYIPALISILYLIRSSLKNKSC